MLKKVTLHFLFYLVACFVAVLPLNIVVILFTVKDLGMGALMIALIAYLISILLAFPGYLIFISIISIKRIITKKFFTISGIVVSLSVMFFFCFVYSKEITEDVVGSFFTIVIVAVLFALFGRLAASTYFKLCSKYLPDFKSKGGQ